MKRIFTLAGLVCLYGSLSAQQDSGTRVIINAHQPVLVQKKDTMIINTPQVVILHNDGRDTVPRTSDTIRIGSMVIIRGGRDIIQKHFHRDHHNDNVHTNWMVIDLGFNGVNDRTNYAQGISNGTLAPGASSDWFTQRNFRSTNVNIWIFMQRINLINHVVNFKYGAGLELNNYKYRENVRFAERGLPYVYMDDVDYRKNKLALDYLTVPLMLNFNFTPHKKNPFGISAGISAGYLYSSRQKTNGGGMGKRKYRDDFEERNFKIAYIAELNLGMIKLYGSYAVQNMFKKGLDQVPYSFGIRLAN